MKIQLVSVMTLGGTLAMGGLLSAQPAASSGAITPARKPLVCPGPECVPCQEGCTVNVSMQMEHGQCKVKGVTVAHKIWHVRVDQRVRWVFHNECASAMNVGIGQFGPHPKETCTDPPNHGTHEQEVKEKKVDEDPFVEGERSVPIEPKKKQELVLAIKHEAWRPRTYKYAIMVDGKPALDPEIEIER